MMFQPTPPAREATLRQRVTRLWRVVSTHAPRAGGDTFAVRACADSSRFQPTPPAREATSSARRCGVSRRVSTHAPRAGGDYGVRA